MLTIEEVRVQIADLVRTSDDFISYWYWEGWLDYLKHGSLQVPSFDQKQNEEAYFMGFADAKGEDYGHF